MSWSNSKGYSVYQQSLQGQIGKYRSLFQIDDAWLHFPEYTFLNSSASKSEIRHLVICSNTKRDTKWHLRIFVLPETEQTIFMSKVPWLLPVLNVGQQTDKHHY